MADTPNGKRGEGQRQASSGDASCASLGMPKWELSTGGEEHSKKCALDEGTAVPRGLSVGSTADRAHDAGIQDNAVSNQV